MKAQRGHEEAVMKAKVRYEVLLGGEWFRVSRATTGGMREGWLHWSCRDGSTGLAAPGKWRVVWQWVAAVMR